MKLAKQPVLERSIQREDVDPDAASKGPLEILGHRGGCVIGLGERIDVIGIVAGMQDLVGLRQLGCAGEQALIVGPGDADVYVVIPRHETLMPNGPDQGTTRDEIADVLSLTQLDDSFQCANGFFLIFFQIEGGSDHA